MPGTPDRLRCEYHAHPLGLDVAQPRLSWALRGAGEAARQTACAVQVAEAGAGFDEKLLWDSGRVESSSPGLVYGGAALTSHQRVAWRVRVWDGDGEASDWSGPAGWAMGMLRPEDWEARWVRSPVGACPNAGLYRKRFELRDGVVDARLYATARGVYTASINGRAVSDERFAPGWTDYRQRITCRCHDVLDLLRAGGANALGAVLNVGWHGGPIGLLGGHRHYGGPPHLLMCLRLEYADGTVEHVGTDGTWKTAPSHVLASTFLDGESQDATLYRDGWDTPEHDDAGWYDAREAGPPTETLVWHPGPPVRPVRTLEAVDKWQPREGAWIIDLGQNFAGVCRVRLPAGTPAGTTLRLRHGEMVNPDRTLYVENLRAALSIDTYTARGDAFSGGARTALRGAADGDRVAGDAAKPEVFEPMFTFHGFRYVEVTGWPTGAVGEPPLDAFEGLVLHSDCAPAGSLRTGHAMVNRLLSNIIWTQRANWIDIPTDCPQRDERLGWTGDAQAFCRTAMWNDDVASFFTKWMTDVNDAQHDDGRYTNVAPDLPRKHDNPKLHFGDAAWGDAGVIVPWTMWRAYGDTRVIERCWPHMAGWLAWQERDADANFIRRHDPKRHQVFGDWLSIDAETHRDLIMTAFFAYDAALMAQMAAAVGKEGDAASYARLSQKIAAAFREAFVRDDGHIARDDEPTTQTACLMALRFGLVEGGLADRVFARLLEDIEARGWHLSTGFVGLPYLMHVLSDFGRSDVAYRLLLNTTFPSWGYSIEQGATTMWERWNGWLKDVGPGDPSMNSFSHYAYGSVGQWLYEEVAGIKELEPGFARFRVRPRVDPRVGPVDATHRSVRGEIRAAWAVDSRGAVTLDVTVPANTMAEVWAPTAADPAAADDTYVEHTCAPGTHRFVNGEAAG